MITLAYYHRNGRRSHFRDANALREYFSEYKTLILEPSFSRKVKMREIYNCTHHPKRVAVGYYTEVDKDYKRLGEVYCCEECADKREGAYLELGEIYKVFGYSAWLWGVYKNGDSEPIARIITGEHALKRALPLHITSCAPEPRLVESSGA